MNNKKYLTDIETKQALLEQMKEKKKLEKSQEMADFISERQKLNLAPTKSPGFSSQLDRDKMLVSGGTEHIKPSIMEKTPIEDFQLAQLYKSAEQDTKLAQKAKEAGKEIEVLDYNKLRKEMPKTSRFSRIAQKIGGRGLKALPIVGTAMGLSSAMEQAQAGEMGKAGMEALSAIDPTGASDLYMLGNEIADEFAPQTEEEMKKKALMNYLRKK